MVMLVMLIVPMTGPPPEKRLKKTEKILKWYFITKIVLTYCEKKLFE